MQITDKQFDTLIALVMTYAQEHDEQSTKLEGYNCACVCAPCLTADDLFAELAVAGLTALKVEK